MPSSPRPSSRSRRWRLRRRSARVSVTPGAWLRSRPPAAPRLMKVLAIFMIRTGNSVAPWAARQAPRI
ncbi:Uncharacterised protein [Bordetella pertussis]|nr:Uncharacterised protein [Bordetella pertussis]